MDVRGGCPEAVARPSSKQRARWFAASWAVDSDWLGAKKTPSKKNLERILDLLDVDWDAVRRKPGSGPHTGTPSSDVVRVPRDERPPTDGEEAPTDPYPRMELERLTGAAPEQLRSLTVVGDYLADEILPNTRVLYLPVQEYVGDGLYAMEVDGTVVPKLLQRPGGGAFEFIPRNGLYRRELFVPVEEEPDTYRSEITGLTSRIRFAGKVVYYPKSA